MFTDMTGKQLEYTERKYQAITKFVSNIELGQLWNGWLLDSTNSSPYSQFVRNDSTRPTDTYIKVTVCHSSHWSLIMETEVVFNIIQLAWLIAQKDFTADHESSTEYHDFW